MLPGRRNSTISPNEEGASEGEIEMKRLAGKVAIVTGCTSGIGPETARALHAAGMDVWCAGRDEARVAKGMADVGLDLAADARLHEIGRAHV